MQWTPFWSFLRKQFRRLATAQLLDPYPNCAEAWSFLRKNGKILRPGNSFGKWLRQIPHIEVGEAWHMWFFHDEWIESLESAERIFKLSAVAALTKEKKPV